MESDEEVARRLLEAENKYPSLPRLTPPLVLELDAREVIKGMFTEGEFYFASEDGVPIVTNPFTCQSIRVNEHLVKREQYSTALCGYAWADSQCGLLQRLWKKKNRFPSLRNKLASVNIVMDKRNHSRNASKRGEHSTLPCQICHKGPDDQGHVLLECPARPMAYIRARMISDLKRVAAAKSPPSAQPYISAMAYGPLPFLSACSKLLLVDDWDYSSVAHPIKIW